MQLSRSSAPISISLPSTMTVGMNLPDAILLVVRCGG
jgi:hypothetical protein